MSVIEENLNNMFERFESLKKYTSQYTERTLEYNKCKGIYDKCKQEYEKCEKEYNEFKKIYDKCKQEYEECEEKYNKQKQECDNFLKEYRECRRLQVEAYESCSATKLTDEDIHYLIENQKGIKEKLGDTGDIKIDKSSFMRYLLQQNKDIVADYIFKNYKDIFKPEYNLFNDMGITSEDKLAIMYTQEFEEHYNVFNEDRDKKQSLRNVKKVVSYFNSAVKNENLSSKKECLNSAKEKYETLYQTLYKTSISPRVEHPAKPSSKKIKIKL